MIFAFLCKVDAKFGKVVMWENYPMKGKQTYKHKLSRQLPWESIFNFYWYFQRESIDTKIYMQFQR